VVVYFIVFGVGLVYILHFGTNWARFADKAGPITAR
jgi:hypothetical protein